MTRGLVAGRQQSFFKIRMSESKKESFRNFKSHNCPINSSIGLRFRLFITLLFKTGAIETGG